MKLIPPCFFAKPFIAEFHKRSSNMLTRFSFAAGKTMHSKTFIKNELLSKKLTLGQKATNLVGIIFLKPIKTYLATACGFPSSSS